MTTGGDQEEEEQQQERRFLKIVYLRNGENNFENVKDLSIYLHVIYGRREGRDVEGNQNRLLILKEFLKARHRTENRGK